MRKPKISQKTKNIVSIFLPITSLLIISLAINMSPTGFVVYETKTLYKINGTISINLPEKIPVDSHIEISIGKDVIKMNIMEFLEKSGRKYSITKEKNQRYLTGDKTYTLNFASLGIYSGFEEGTHPIITKIIHNNSTLYMDEYTLHIP